MPSQTVICGLDPKTARAGKCYASYRTGVGAFQSLHKWSLYFAPALRPPACPAVAFYLRNVFGIMPSLPCAFYGSCYVEPITIGRCQKFLRDCGVTPLSICARFFHALAPVDVPLRWLGQQIGAFSAIRDKRGRERVFIDEIRDEICEIAVVVATSARSTGHSGTQNPPRSTLVRPVPTCD